MNRIPCKANFRAFGFNISSEIPFPEISSNTPISTGCIDICITKRNLSSDWDDLSLPNRYFIVKEDFILFKIPDVGFFKIEKGRNIIVSPFKGTQMDQIRLYILGTCMGSILLQRKTLPLHGSTVVIDGKAYAIIGESGAGKSTLATLFLKNDYKLLTDDIIPISLNVDDVPMVIPSYPQQKLWQESLDQFEMNTRDYRPLFERETKFAVPVTKQFMDKPVPLAGIFELVKSDGDGISLQPIVNLHRFQTLYKQTYRNFLVKRMGLLDWHFTTCSKMVNKLSMYQLQRPAEMFTAYELKDLILSTISKGDLVYG